MEKEMDILQQYKNISNKLKKRFLKKPNLVEGSEQFGTIAKQLKSRECPQYSGFFYLAQARCEQTSGNWTAESQALLDAARSFLEAEKSIVDIQCPSFQEHLNAAINCYNHAIRVYTENKQFNLAASLSLEVGNVLRDLNKHSQSIQHYQLATELLKPQPMEYLLAAKHLAHANIQTKDFDGALSTYIEMENYAREYGPKSSEGGQHIGAIIDVLKDCQICRLFLLLLLKYNAQRVKPDNVLFLEKFSWDAKDEVIASSYLYEDLYIHLQSLVLVCQSKDKDELNHVESQIYPYLTSMQHHLLYLVVTDIINPSENSFVHHGTEEIF